MKNKIIKHIYKFRNILLSALAILLVGIIITLGWVNHRDFERSVINAELRELLIIAKSASHDIEKGVISVKQEPQYIDKLIQHINDEGAFTTFVMNSRHIILSDPVKRYVGKNILEIGKNVLNAQELSRLNIFVEKLDSVSSGTEILSFPAENARGPNKEIKLLAFAHLQNQTDFDSVVVTERLSALTGPIYRNLRNILVLIGLFFLVILTFGYIFYRIQKKRIRMETTTRALEIINKQLHCEIEDYRCIKKGLKGPRE